MKETKTQEGKEQEVVIFETEREVELFEENAKLKDELEAFKDLSMDMQKQINELTKTTKEQATNITDILRQQEKILVLLTDARQRVFDMELREQTRIVDTPPVAPPCTPYRRTIDSTTEWPDNPERYNNMVITTGTGTTPSEDSFYRFVYTRPGSYLWQAYPDLDPTYEP